MHYLDEHQYIFSNQKNFKFIPRYAFLIAMKMKCNLSSHDYIYTFILINSENQYSFQIFLEKENSIPKKIFILYTTIYELKIVNLKIRSRKGCDRFVRASVYNIRQIYELETHGSARMWCNDLESNAAEPREISCHVSPGGGGGEYQFRCANIRTVMIDVVETDRGRLFRGALSLYPACIYSNIKIRVQRPPVRG